MKINPVINKENHPEYSALKRLMLSLKFLGHLTGSLIIRKDLEGPKASEGIVRMG